ncbi:MAG: hypothetical protein HY816_00135 [Candidatus Wallbacteria bacterium]|nr:hypothetical protein [Candidatus Wallbacteria bacterium]
MHATQRFLVAWGLAFLTAVAPASEQSSSEEVSRESVESVNVADWATDDRQPGTDPFRVLLQPPPPPDPPSDTEKPANPPAPPRPPALNATLVGFASESDHCTPVLEYAGELFLLDEHWKSPDGRIAVKSIRLSGPGYVEVELTDALTSRRTFRVFGDPPSPPPPVLGCGGVYPLSPRQTSCVIGP